MPLSMLVRASKWISPGVRLRIADVMGLPLTSGAQRTRALQYVTRNIVVGGRAWPYAVWSPQGASGASLPVILFLHGAGERGLDGHAQTKVGLGLALCQFPDRYPAHVVMPQCPVGFQWSGLAEKAALGALADTIDVTAADERRVYVTGVSMGAHGALRLAARHPSRFAAVIAICGWGNTNEIVRGIKDIPAWLFHGADDPIVPARCSAELATALRLAGARDIRHTEYAAIGHECWDLAYAEPQLQDWLFAQSR